MLWPGIEQISKLKKNFISNSDKNNGKDLRNFRKTDQFCFNLLNWKTLIQYNVLIIFYLKDFKWPDQVKNK